MDCEEYREIISAHVDEALPPEERTRAEFHLHRCQQCRETFLWEKRVVNTLKRKLTPSQPFPGLKRRVLEQLGNPPRQLFLGWSYFSHGLAAAFTVLLLALPYLFWPTPVRDDIFADTVSRYQRITEGNVEPSLSSSWPTARLLDLSPWGYRLLSGQARRSKGREVRIFVYYGRDREYLLAQEFEGTDFSRPSGSRVIRASRRDFVSFSQKGVNFVLWKDRDLLCMLASKLPKKRLLTLAQEVTTRS